MILFRTDASAKTGFGHIKRSVYLASLLKHKTPILFCTGGDKIAVRYLDEKKIPHISLKQVTKWPDKSFEPLRGAVFDLRHYDDEDKELLKRARSLNKKTVQITDLGLSQQEVDITVDSSLEPLFPYSPGRVLLHGPGYAILHNKFRHFNNVRRKYRETITKVFLCLGGAADYQRLRAAIDMLTRHRYTVKVAPGFYLKKSALKTLKRIYPGVSFVGKTDSLARAFFEADIALITSGVAAFEAAAVGTPALYFYYHDEQKAVARSFEKQGAGLVISNIDDLLNEGKRMITVLHELTREHRVQIGERAKELVDAGGVYRIIDCFEHALLER
jgi:spore coat polysaccharide biosynthesis predicted glycosyltransferase SpsG